MLVRHAPSLLLALTLATFSCGGDSSGGGGQGGAPGGGGGAGGSVDPNVQSCGSGQSYRPDCLSCLRQNCAAEFADAFGPLWEQERIAAAGSCGPVWKCYCDCRTQQPACPKEGISGCPSRPDLLPPGCWDAMTKKSSCGTQRCPDACRGQI
jgi:hypothetical protein